MPPPVPRTKAINKIPAINKMPASYERSYSKLNENQKLAVDAIEGPVMVIAGPGTGKTHVVAMRVANILRKTQMKPGNILCLTYSVNAATEMRDRLRSLIGQDAYRVAIKNFHGFCNDLIQDNPIIFDGLSALEHISEVEKTKEVNKIVDQLLPDLVLVNKKNPYSKTMQIIKRISEFKREGRGNPQELAEIADEYENQMSMKSRDGTKAHEKNMIKARKFKELVRVFSSYQEMLEKTERYDFEDMILFVIKALKEEDWLLASLQERYQYLLVDEFQDTNGSQINLLELLSSSPVLKHDPNLFVVGDDDQAIYRFQGANVQNILSFKNRFPDAPVIVLNESYRCVQNILDSACNLISNNTERLVGRIEGLNKNLVSLRSGTEVSPRLVYSSSDSTEAGTVCDIVKAKLDSGIDPGDIAVLVRTNKDLNLLYDAFTARGIPVRMNGKADLLNEPLVKQAVAILRAVENEKNNSNLASALSCECFGCHPADLARLFQRIESEGRTLLSLILDLEQADYISRKEPLIKARDVILDLHNKLESRNVADTLEHLLKETGLLPFARGGLKKFDPLAFAMLQEFFERVKNRAYEDPNFSFHEFLEDLSYYENPDYPDLRLRFDLPHLSAKGVNLMTAHQSKGLEFKVVIIPNFREGHWDKRKNPSRIPAPEDLLFGRKEDKSSFEENQDERRLAYVAITRAKDEVVFVCPKELTNGDKTREVLPSSFFAEAGKLEEKMHDPANLSSENEFLTKPVRDFDSETKAFLLERLENYSLSVTALNHFLEDPQMFLEIDLLRVPQAKKPELVYGNAVHSALKKWGFAFKAGERLSEEKFLEEFKHYLNTREILTASEKARLAKVGEEALPRYFREILDVSSPIIHQIEYSVSAHLNQGAGPKAGVVPIKGQIDRIDLLAPDSSAARVIDFKTGIPKTEKQIRDDGGYFRQLVFYALILRCANAFVEPKEFILEFIGEGTEHPVRRSFSISQPEIDDLKKVVRGVWEKIGNLDFTPLA